MYIFLQSIFTSIVLHVSQQRQWERKVVRRWGSGPAQQELSGSELGLLG